MTYIVTHQDRATGHKIAEYGEYATEREALDAHPRNWTLMEDTPVGVVAVWADENALWIVWDEAARLAYVQVTTHGDTHVNRVDYIPMNPDITPTDISGGEPEWIDLSGDSRKGGE